LSWFGEYQNYTLIENLKKIFSNSSNNSCNSAFRYSTLLFQETDKLQWSLDKNSDLYLRILVSFDDKIVMILLLILYSAEQCPKKYGYARYGYAKFGVSRIRIINKISYYLDFISEKKISVSLAYPSIRIR